MSIHDHYEAARKELLDLGLRNSLLNYRHSSARGVRVQGESSVEIYDLLVRGEKEMTFVPRKGLEVDLSPHLTNARQRLEDLPKWPGKGVVDKDLGAPEDGWQFHRQGLERRDEPAAARGGGH